MKISKLTIISLAYGTILLFLSGWWLFNIVRTPYNRYLSIFWLPLLVLIFISISRSTSDQRRESTPLKINLIVLGWLVALVIFRGYWDLDFILHGKEYVSAVQDVNLSQLNLSKDSARGVYVPLDYRYLSVFDQVYVTRDKGSENFVFVFPNTPGDLDGLLNAYIYVSGETSAELPEKCFSGRPVNPHYENWYYCVVSLNQIR